MGYEKLEPSIQRKDVDRRFTHLRKQQIRNTALRFKFNVITQKFQTYSMYWTRVCRQIEEGTYKRHVIKAARRFGGTETKREHDDAIDVELGDFEEVDMDALLAEIDAETAAHEPSGLTHDTVPPGMLTVPPAVEVRPFQGAKAAPGAWFSIGGARDAIDVDPSIAEDAVTAGRAPRQAALPPGAKPRVVLRRRPEGDLSPPSAPISHGRSGSSPDVRPSTGAGPISAGQPSKIQHPAPVIRTASGGEGHRPPAVAPETARRAPGPGAAPPTVSSTPAVSLPPAVSDPPSAGLPAGGVSAPPSAAAAASTPPSAGRMPASTPSWGAGGAGRRIPAIAPAGSSGRTSLPAGAGVRVPTPASPMTPQAAPAPGAPRPSTTTGPTPGPSPTRPTPASPMAAGPAPTPVAPVAGAPAANRPVPPSANRIPLPSATARATPATPMTPVAPPAPAGVKPAGPPAPASPGPKAPDSEQLRLNRRPPLPSQVKKDS